MKLFVVTIALSVGKASTLGLFPRKKLAEDCVTKDMKRWQEENAERGVRIDREKMAGYFPSCREPEANWNIEEVAVWEPKVSKKEIAPVKVYGKTSLLRINPTKEGAKTWFTTQAMMTEGSEHERMIRCLNEVENGKTEIHLYA